MNIEKKIDIKIKYLEEAFKNEIKYATPFSVGLDLRSRIKQTIEIAPFKRVIIPTGIAIEILIPHIAGFIFSRSGIGIKKGLIITQGVGVIDPDYRGEIKVSLFNISNSSHQINYGDRIAQLIFMPAFQANIIEASSLSNTQRGEGGFGHTGI